MDNGKELIRDLLELFSDNDKLLEAISPMPQDFQAWLYAVGGDFASNFKYLKPEVKEDIVDRLAVHFGLKEKSELNDDAPTECEIMLERRYLSKMWGSHLNMLKDEERERK